MNDASFRKGSVVSNAEAKNQVPITEAGQLQLDIDDATREVKNTFFMTFFCVL